MPDLQEESAEQAQVAQELPPPLRVLMPSPIGPLGVELLESVLCLDGTLLNEAAASGLPVFEHAPASRAEHHQG